MTSPSLRVGGRRVAGLLPYISSLIVHILARQACNPVHIELEGIWDYGAKLVYIKGTTSIRFFFCFVFCFNPRFMARVSNCGRYEYIAYWRAFQRGRGMGSTTSLE